MRRLRLWGTIHPDSGIWSEPKGVIVRVGGCLSCIIVGDSALIAASLYPRCGIVFNESE